MYWFRWWRQTNTFFEFFIIVKQQFTETQQQQHQQQNIIAKKNVLACFLLFWLIRGNLQNKWCSSWCTITKKKTENMSKMQFIILFDVCGVVGAQKKFDFNREIESSPLQLKNWSVCFNFNERFCSRLRLLCGNFRCNESDYRGNRITKWKRLPNELNTQWTEFSNEPITEWTILLNELITRWSK